MFQCEIELTFGAAETRYSDKDEEVSLAQRKTLRSLDISVLLSAFASVVAVAAIGLLVHEIMWARISANEAAASTSKPTPAPRVRISSKTLAA
jgi:hypothetical protein